LKIIKLENERFFLGVTIGIKIQNLCNRAAQSRHSSEYNSQQVYIKLLIIEKTGKITNTIK